MRAHGGAISVESELGEGSRFRVWIPSAGDALVRTELPQRTTVEPRSQASGRVLVVDDDETVRRIAMRVLERAGYEVVPAENGREALDFLEKGADDFSAILLDLTMPVMGGVETLSRLREMSCDIPVVLCSGYSAERARGRFDNLQVQGFVEKPFTIDALLDATRAVTDWQECDDRGRLGRRSQGGRRAVPGIRS